MSNHNSRSPAFQNEPGDHLVHAARAPDDHEFLSGGVRHGMPPFEIDARMETLVEADEALRANIGETVDPLESSVQGGEARRGFEEVRALRFTGSAPGVTASDAQRSRWRAGRCPLGDGFVRVLVAVVVPVPVRSRVGAGP